MEQPTIGRRGALGVVAAATLLATRGMATPASPADGLRTYMLMRGALDERLVIGCVSGTYYAVIDDALTPLFGVVSATFARYKPRPGGGYAAASVESAYFTDLATGAALTDFANPLTGATVAVPAGGNPAAAIAILPDLTLQVAKLPPGVAFDHRIGAPETRGDDVWLTEVTRTSGKAPGAARAFHYSESTTLHARASDLARPGVRRVPTETAFTNVVSWRPWLQMGDRPGHLMAIGAGTYGASLDTLPLAWLAATRARRPELLADPAAALEPVWRTLA
jgi:hypothetical protein